jgi:hypothetical protein
VSVDGVARSNQASLLELCSWLNAMMNFSAKVFFFKYYRIIDKTLLLSLSKEKAQLRLFF